MLSALKSSSMMLVKVGIDQVLGVSSRQAAAGGDSHVYDEDLISGTLNFRCRCQMIGLGGDMATENFVNTRDALEREKSLRLNLYAGRIEETDVTSGEEKRVPMATVISTKIIDEVLVCALHSLHPLHYLIMLVALSYTLSLQSL